jgi:hypothetical protein
MLTERKYAIIGAITIRCNEMDFILGHYLKLFIGTHEREIAAAIVKDTKFFARRKDLLFRVLTIIEKQYPDLQPKVAALRAHASEAKDLYDARNKIAHSRIVPDFRRGTWVLTFDEKELDWSEEKLDALERAISIKANWLLVTCINLWQDLLVRRDGEAWWKEAGLDPVEDDENEIAFPLDETPLAVRASVNPQEADE